MKLYMIRRTDTGEFAGMNSYTSQWTKKAPRTFFRRSDLSNHLNQSVHAKANHYQTLHNYYRDVQDTLVEILYYDFNEDNKQSFSITAKRISLEDYMNNLWNNQLERELAK